MLSSRRGEPMLIFADCRSSCTWREAAFIRSTPCRACPCSTRLCLCEAQPSASLCGAETGLAAVQGRDRHRHQQREAPGGQILPRAPSTIYSARFPVHTPAHRAAIKLSQADWCIVRWLQGCKDPRLDGEEHMEAVEEFCLSAQKQWPNCLIQFEDFPTDKVPSVPTARLT